MLRVCALVSILFFSLGAVAAEKELSDRSLIQSILANQKDPYLVLGLSPNCTEADVKSAYKKLSKRLHPDSNSSKQASEAMAIVNASKDKFFDRETKEFFLPTKDSPESGYSHGTDPYEKFAKDFKSGSPEQKKKLIRQILRGSPSLSELHEYMSGVYSEELRSEIYHLAIRETTKPVQILKLISPLGLRPGGGNWIALWKNALGEELPHFFALNPTHDEAETLRSFLRLVFRNEGERLFRDAAAGISRKGMAISPEKSMAGSSPSCSKFFSGFGAFWRHALGD